jgi:hypothetical protein
MKVIRNIGRGIAGLLVLPTVLLTVGCLFVVALVPAILRPETIKSGLAEQNIYDDLLPIVLPALVNNTTVLDTNFPFDFEEIRANMGDDDWRAVTNELVPPEWLQVQLEAVIDGTYDYLRGAPNISYEIDVETLLERLSGEPGQRAITRITTLSAPCTVEEVEQIRALTTDAELGAIPVCTPANERDRARLESAYQRAFAILTVQLQMQESAYADGLIGPFGFREELNISGEGQVQIDIVQSDEDDIMIALRVFLQTYELYRPIFFLLPIMGLSLIVAFGVSLVEGVRTLGRHHRAAHQRGTRPEHVSLLNRYH